MSWKKGRREGVTGEGGRREGRRDGGRGKGRKIGGRTIKRKIGLSDRQSDRWWFLTFYLYLNIKSSLFKLFLFLSNVGECIINFTY